MVLLYHVSCRPATEVWLLSAPWVAIFAENMTMAFLWLLIRRGRNSWWLMRLRTSLGVTASCSFKSLRITASRTPTWAGQEPLEGCVTMGTRPQPRVTGHVRHCAVGAGSTRSKSRRITSAIAILSGVVMWSAARVKELLKKTSVNRPRSMFLKETVRSRKTQKRRVNNREKERTRDKVFYLALTTTIEKWRRSKVNTSHWTREDWQRNDNNEVGEKAQ